MKKYFINEDWEAVQYEDDSQVFLLIVEQSLPAHSYIHQVATAAEDLVPMFSQLVEQYKDVAIDELFRISIISLPNTAQVQTLIAQAEEYSIKSNAEAAEIINMLCTRADCEVLCDWTKQALQEKATKRNRKRKKPFSSMFDTTGCPKMNMAFFNSRFGTGDLQGASCGEDSCICDSSEGGSLTEAKRYVKRYYIRPQNVFCSNKAEILQALVKDVGEANCSVYSLKSLDDHDDVHLLKPSDIIYYYDDGILYDKNHVKVMDYDLNVKHEEERKKFADIDAVSDTTFDTEYEDRLTEGKHSDDKCCICGETFTGYGNNPAPVAEKGRCCDACNLKFVIPARFTLGGKEYEEN